MDRLKLVLDVLKHMDASKTMITTPVELCREIVRTAIDFNNWDQRVVDPTCGKGTFLLTVIEGFVNAGCPVDHIVNNIIHGYDISKKQVRHTSKNIFKATGIMPQNIHVQNSLDIKNIPHFDVMVGNYPFNDSSDTAGRNTNKIKENTADLDNRFYMTMLSKADIHAVILRSSCLGKKSKIRESIFSDNHVHTIKNTSKFFNIAPATMCVFRDTSVITRSKTFIDKDGETWKYNTDKNTKITPNMNKSNISIVEKVREISCKGNFGQHWLRAGVGRSDINVNDSIGIPFVEITGEKGKQIETRYYNGNDSAFKALDKWKVITNVNASAMTIGAIKVVEPGVATSNSIVYFPFDTKAEAEACLKYLESEYVKTITPIFKNSAGNSSEFFENIPYTNFLDSNKVSEISTI